MAIDIVNGKVRVYNYGLSPVGFPSQHSSAGVFIRGREEDEEYVVERVYWDDIESENTKSDLFKVGILRFHPDEEDEIYNKLGIEDRENIMSDAELRKFLLGRGIDTIKRISKINSLALLTRMKSMLFQLERMGDRPDADTTSAVSERLSELISGGKRNSNGVISRILEAERERKKKQEMESTLESIMQRLSQLEQEREEQEKVIVKKDQVIAESENAIKDLLKQVEKLNKQVDKLNNEKKKPSKEDAKEVGG